MGLPDMDRETNIAILLGGASSTGDRWDNQQGKIFKKLELERIWKLLLHLSKVGIPNL